MKAIQLRGYGGVAGLGTKLFHLRGLTPEFLVKVAATSVNGVERETAPGL